MALTKYEEGSVRELWALSFPLMLSSLSMTCMIFVDRLLLAWYSTAALNAAVNATTLGWAVTFGWLTMTNIAEVVVAQLNGAGRKEQLGWPVWQMIWLGLGSFLCFFPLAFWGAEWIYGREEMALQKDYFRWMLFFGPCFPIYGALVSFFVGQGKTALITWLAVIANLVNACLDLVLIFGIEGIVPSLGVKGAAIATSFGVIFQIVVLGYVFLKKRNRQHHGTGEYVFRSQLFWQCVYIGFPNALFVFIEIGGWAAFYWMMTLVGEKYITIAGICQSLLILFFFFGDGINKGATTIAGNLIGASKSFLISRVVKAGALLHVFFFSCVICIFYCFSDLVITQFLPDVEQGVVEGLKTSLKISLLLMSGNLFFEGIRLLLCGVLTAAGDTLFLMIAGTISIWLMLILPVYFLVVQGGASIEVGMSITVFYALASSFIYAWRFYRGYWKVYSFIEKKDLGPAADNRVDILV